MHSLQPSCLPPKGATRMHLQVSAQHDTIYYHQMGNEMILGSSQPEIWLINLQGASWVVSGSSHSSCRAYPNMRIRYQSFWKHTCKPNCVCLASRFLAKRLKWFFFSSMNFASHLRKAERSEQWTHGCVSSWSMARSCRIKLWGRAVGLRPTKVSRKNAVLNFQLLQGFQGMFEPHVLLEPFWNMVYTFQGL